GAAAAAQAGTLIPLNAMTLASAAGVGHAGTFFSQIAPVLSGAVAQASAGAIVAQEPSSTLQGAAMVALAGRLLVSALAAVARTGVSIHGVVDLGVLPPGPPAPFINAIDPNFVGPVDTTRRLTTNGVVEDN